MFTVSGLRTQFSTQVVKAYHFHQMNRTLGRTVIEVSQLNELGACKAPNLQVELLTLSD